MNRSHTDRDAPIRLASNGRPAVARTVAVDARRHLRQSLWLTGVIAVGLVAVVAARPVGAAMPQPQAVHADR